MRQVPWRAEGGCTPFRHHRSTKWDSRITTTTGGVLLEGERDFFSIHESLLTLWHVKDAYLPQRLMDKLMCFVNYVEMSRVTGVPFNYLLARGQSIKVLCQLYRKANEEGYLVPSTKGEGMTQFLHCICHI